ncbi:hypothetical protein GCM10027170_40450 [Aliiglaciecola aliphaticivorans]
MSVVRSGGTAFLKHPRSPPCESTYNGVARALARGKGALAKIPAYILNGVARASVREKGTLE